MSRKSQRTAAPSDAQPETKMVAIAEGRRPQLDDESARATAKASMAAGFPAPQQLVAQLGDQVLAEIAAELEAEAVERAQAAPVDEAAAGETAAQTQTLEG